MSSLVGCPQNELDQEDALTASLTNLAYSVVREQPASEGRTSRFWFRLDDTEETVAKAKRSMAPKEVEHIDAEVESRLADYQTELPVSLKAKMEEVREFFLTEIAPLTLASSGGNLQSKEVVQRLLDTEVDSAIFAKFDNMVNRAATLKLALFTLRYFDLPESFLNSILGQAPSEYTTLVSRLDNIQGTVGLLNRTAATIQKESASKRDVQHLANTVKTNEQAS